MQSMVLTRQKGQASASSGLDRDSERDRTPHRVAKAARTIDRMSDDMPGYTEVPLFNLGSPEKR